MITILTTLVLSTSAFAVSPATTPVTGSYTCLPGHSTYFVSDAQGLLIEVACTDMTAPAPVVEECDELCQAKKQLAGLKKSGAATAQQTQANTEAIDALSKRADGLQGQINDTNTRIDQVATATVDGFDALSATDARHDQAIAGLADRMTASEERELHRCTVYGDAGLTAIGVVDIQAAGGVSGGLDIECSKNGYRVGGAFGMTDGRGASSSGSFQAYLKLNQIHLGGEIGGDVFGSGVRETGLTTERTSGGYAAVTIGGIAADMVLLNLSLGAGSYRTQMAEDGHWTAAVDNFSRIADPRISARATFILGRPYQGFTPATAGE